jgi:hypothetical protein
LLYINPLATWPNPTDGATGTLAYIAKGEYHCYDVNASFPRYSVVNGDTVDLTIRAANAGAYLVRGISVEVFADTVTRDSVNDGQTARLPDGLIKIGERGITDELSSQQFGDVRFEAVLPVGTKRVWFAVDSAKRYFECNEKDNAIVLKLE